MATRQISRMVPVLVVTGTVLLLLATLAVFETDAVSGKEPKVLKTAVDLDLQRTGEPGPESPREPPSTVSLHEVSGGELKILSKLDDPTEFEFVDLPLRDVVNYLSQRHEITILLDAAALADAGIETTEPVNMALTGVRLRSALGLLLSQLALDFLVADDVLKITTASVVSLHMTTRVYPIGDLVDAGIDPGAVIEAVELATSRWRDDETGQGQTVVGSGMVAHFGPRAHDAVADLMGQLRRLIQLEAGPPARNRE
jgi:hypothetical protein